MSNGEATTEGMSAQSQLTATQMHLLQGSSGSQGASSGGVVGTADTIVFNPFPAQAQTLCTLCQRYVCGEEGSENWKVHIEGRPHLRAAALAAGQQVLPEAEGGDATSTAPAAGAIVAPKSPPAGTVPGTTNICEICDKVLPGVRGDCVWQTHVAGGAHIRAATLKALAAASPSEPVQVQQQPANRAEASWYCDVCRKTLLCRYGDPDYLLHVRGEKHLRAEKLLREPPKPTVVEEEIPKELAVPPQLPPTAAFCVVCETAVPGSRDGSNWASHIDGQAHRKKLKRMEELFPKDYLDVIRQREEFVQKKQQQQATAAAAASKKEASSSVKTEIRQVGEGSISTASPLAGLVTALSSISSSSSAFKRCSLFDPSQGIAASPPAAAKQLPDPPATAPSNAHLFISVREMMGFYGEKPSLLPEDLRPPSRKLLLSFAHLKLSSPAEIQRGAASGAVWWHARDGSSITSRSVIASAVEQVVALRPDVVSLQHVELSMKSDLNTSLKASCRDIAYELTPTSEALSPSLQRTRDGNANFPIVCIAYSKQRFSLLSQRLRNLEAAVDNMSGLEYGYMHARCTRPGGLTRNPVHSEAQLLVLVLEELTTRKVFVVAACELPHQPHLDDFRVACIREAYSFTFALADIANTSRVVMLGDLGCPPTSMAYRHLTDLTQSILERRHVRADDDGDEGPAGTILDDEPDGLMCMARKGVVVCGYAMVVTLPIAFIGEWSSMTSILIDESGLADPRDIFTSAGGVGGGGERSRWEKWGIAVYDEVQGAYMPLISSADLSQNAPKVILEGKTYVSCELPGPYRFNGTSRSLRVTWVEAQPSTTPVSILRSSADFVPPRARFSVEQQLIVEGRSFGIRREASRMAPQQHTQAPSDPLVDQQQQSPASTWDLAIGGLMRSAYASYRQWATKVGVPQIPKDAADPLLPVMGNVYVDIPPALPNGLAISRHLLSGNFMTLPVRLQQSIPYAEWQRSFGPYAQGRNENNNEPWFTVAYPCAGAKLPEIINAADAREDSLHRFEWMTTDYILYQREAFKLIRIAKLPSMQSLGAVALPTPVGGAYGASSHLPLCAVLEVA